MKSFLPFVNVSDHSHSFSSSSGRSFLVSTSSPRQKATTFTKVDLPSPFLDAVGADLSFFVAMMRLSEFSLNFMGLKQS